MPSMVRIRITTVVGVDADAFSDVKTRRVEIRMMEMIHVLGRMIGGAWLELISGDDWEPSPLTMNQ